MAIILNGWLGYGTAVQGGVLVEPTDSGYVRRPFVLGDLNQGNVSDVGSGTVGPAVTSWGTVMFLGIYDSQSRGNLLFWLPLPAPITVGAGASVSSIGGSLRFVVADLRNANAVRTWPAGATLGVTPDGRTLTAGVGLQFTGGVLTAQATTFGATIVMASLPSAQPATGSGQLWNNGGVISVA